MQHGNAQIAALEMVQHKSFCEIMSPLQASRLFRTFGHVNKIILLVAPKSNETATSACDAAQVFGWCVA